VTSGGTCPAADPGHLGTRTFDAFLEGLDYPMFIVTVASEGERAGCLVGFSTQVSIDPPRMLVCLSVQNHTYRVARNADTLAVHVLDPGQRDLAELFGTLSGDEIDKFARCSWRPGPSDVPLLDECPRRIVGRVLRRDPVGDHVGFLLDPTGIEVTGTGAGLSYEDVDDLQAGHPA
jgi:flavin reductase (DIM6/NTAB) family NADH-FMN oxidoreductase RutF